MSLHIRCTYINIDRNAMIGEDPDFTRAFTDDRGKLYRSLVKEYGRCISKMYRDRKDGPPIEVGYVFQGRDKYEDSKDTYLRETWVEIKNIEPSEEE